MLWTVADMKRRRHAKARAGRDCDGFANWCAPCRYHRTTHVGRSGGLQRHDTLPHIIRCDDRVPVYAHDIVTSGRGDTYVHPKCLMAPGIVQDPHTLMFW